MSPFQNDSGANIRLAMPSDLAQISKITLAAMEDGPDELYSYNFPYRKLFRADHEYYWGVRLRSMLYSKGSIFIVAEERRTKEVVGWALWELNSASGRNKDTPIGTSADTWRKYIGSKSSFQSTLNLAQSWVCRRLGRNLAKALGWRVPKRKASRHRW